MNSPFEGLTGICPRLCRGSLNYRMSIDFWVKTGAPEEKIVPMAGEIHHATAAEIKAYTKEAKAKGVSSLHFYAYQEEVKKGVWDAIRDIS